MQIDFDKMQVVERRLSEIIGELTYEREKLKEIIKLSRIHSLPSSVTEDMKKTSDRFAANIIVAMKMKEAVKKISANFKSGEERIESFIDEGMIEKPDFKYCTYIKDNTDFDWSIE